ncbi:transmembrane protein 65 isoform X1 [Oncorhynchus mykiss]|uniref:Transmembrane protein 65 n=2 Tax=Oncorhynchus mykiss TaxID=8022 RepID=A0A8K9WRS0_ONCMY|nr:transmembrane protein 65 isoform X1 [Oncorhynchus mykiss]
MLGISYKIALRPTIPTRAVLESVTVRKVLKVSHLQSCWMGTLGRNEPREPLNSPKRAKEFIYSLHPKERTCLLKELQSFESIAIAQDSEVSSSTSQLRGQSETPEGEVGLQETQEASPLTRAQIKYVLLHNAIPFIGFGFLDNAIMIAAGTQIELSIGVTFGLSTMAAAALGNLVSDLAGLGLAGYVEVLASRLGMQVPDLTPKQADMWQTRVSSHMGKGIGVTIGCILGMFPLLFLGDDEDESKKKEAHTNTTDS